MSTTEHPQLTREQIEQASGRELDALVATHVFGWLDVQNLRADGWRSAGWFGYAPPERHAEAYCGRDPWPLCIEEYSTSGDAMLLVLERMRGLGWRWFVTNEVAPVCWHVECWADEPTESIRNVHNDAPTLSGAVCRASLLAILAREEAA